jgi:hypothetical protein
VGLATGISAGTTAITAQFAQGSSTVSSGTDLTVTATDIKSSPLLNGTATVRFSAASGSADNKLLIDGQPVAIASNGIVTTVELPAGRHRFASAMVAHYRSHAAGSVQLLLRKNGEVLALTKD